MSRQCRNLRDNKRNIVGSAFLGNMQMSMNQRKSKRNAMANTISSEKVNYTLFLQLTSFCFFGKPKPNQIVVLNTTHHQLANLCMSNVKIAIWFRRKPSVHFATSKFQMLCQLLFRIVRPPNVPIAKENFCMYLLQASSHS